MGVRRGARIGGRSAILVAAAAIANAMAAAVGTGLAVTLSQAEGARDPLIATAVRTNTPPYYQMKHYRSPGLDRSYKCDLVTQLPQAPRVLILGGSRATRFRPSDFTSLTGLPAMNMAMHNFRPEDGWAIASWLYSRAPKVHLRCFVAIQATTFADKPLAPGLLYDRRLSRWFPPALVARQQAKVKPIVADVLGNKRYSSRGLLLWNAYDERRASGESLDDVLDQQIPLLVQKSLLNTKPAQTRSRLYFEKMLKLFNDHGVTPVIVIMPYHPRALAALLDAGWQAKEDRLAAYLADVQTRFKVEVLDLLDIATFGGSPDEFYDTTHVTMENARRIIAYTVATVPQCFASPSPTVTPTASATP